MRPTASVRRITNTPIGGGNLQDLCILQLFLQTGIRDSELGVSAFQLKEWVGHQSWATTQMRHRRCRPSPAVRRARLNNLAIVSANLQGPVRKEP